jgi:NAD-dependent SIR2 family protein deacetylase
MVVIFLGAGASNPYGYPTMEGLNNAIYKASLNSVEEDLLNYLGLREGHDTEAILQGLNLISDLAARKFSDMFSESYVKFSLGKLQPMRFPALTQNCESLILRIKETIFSTYGFRPKQLPLYSDFISLLNDVTKASTHYVYTTNYDRVIEEFCAHSAGFQLVDGFAIDSKSRRILWNPRTFDQPDHENENTLKLFKLHGSLNWLQGEYGIEQVMTETILHSPTPVHKKNLLIYPGSKNPPEEEPFRTLYERFETQMRETDRCLVIGYSFRDAYLNRIFRDFLRSGKSQLLVMSANCKLTVAQNLLGIDQDGLGRYINGNNFLPLPCHFGDDTWRDRLKNALISIPLPIERP